MRVLIFLIFFLLVGCETTKEQTKQPSKKGAQPIKLVRVAPNVYAMEGTETARLFKSNQPAPPNTKANPQSQKPRPPVLKEVRPVGETLPPMPPIPQIDGKTSILIVDPVNQTMTLTNGNYLKQKPEPTKPWYVKAWAVGKYVLIFTVCLGLAAKKLGKKRLLRAWAWAWGSSKPQSYRDNTAPRHYHERPQDNPPVPQSPIPTESEKQS